VLFSKRTRGSGQASGKKLIESRRIYSMERQIPKNVRQIGNVSDSPKIYVEDYVDTFFLQLCDKAKDGPIGAFLVGDMQKSEDEEYVYIYGAIQMHDLKLVGNEYVIDDETWKNAYEDCKQYFEDGEMLGWFVAQPGVELDAKSNIVKLHKKSFPKQNTVFVMKDSAEKEESYFVHKLNDLMEIGGRYTYYEKNPCMQNYMIAARRKNGVSPSETVEDRAAQDFRNMVRSRGSRTHQKKNNRLMYVASSILILVAVIMGVTTLNNFGKMKAVQKVMSQASSAVLQENNTEEVQPVSGEVTEASNEGDVKKQEETPPSEKDASDPEIKQEEEKADDIVQEQESTEGEGDSSEGVYVVEQGDTLAIISKKAYGDVSHVDSICRMNGITDGNLIYVGQKLLLP
jgi:LysM repeat protein